MTGKKKALLLGAGLVVLVLAAPAVLRALRGPGPGAGRPSGLPVLARLPDFVLQDEHGESFSRDDLHGLVWVADFIFTSCAGTCPLITKQLGVLSKELTANPAERSVRFVSVSVDPAHDTPEVLSKYARQQDVDPARWSLVTGPREQVRKLVREGFKLPVGDQSDPAMPIFHSQNFLLIDRAGQVRGVFDALDETARKELRGALDALLAEPPPQDVFVPEDVARPSWLRPRFEAQQASAGAIQAPHDFLLHDRLGASGITFVHHHSVDVGKLYRAIHYDHGTAVALADVDGDGKPDLFFLDQIGPPALYRNLGEGRFEDVTASSGIDLKGRACVGASFADLDNDGDPDLFVTCIRDGNLLFLNDGKGHFTDVTAAAGVAGTGGHSSGALFFDFDGDGLLDLFVTNVGVYTEKQRRQGSPWAGLLDAFAGHLHPERSERSILYKNLGGGRFQDVTESSGLKHEGWSGEAIAFDYDGDGLTDLYVLSMEGHDTLWRNLGGGKFENTGRRVFPRTPWGAMGVAVFDWNGDGLLDLLVTDMHTDMASPLDPADDKKKHDLSVMFPPRFLGTDGNHVLGNALFTARGEGHFEEQSDLANAETGWPWGPSVGDLNADGWPDLFISAGMNYPYRYAGNSVLLNEGGKRFADAEFVLGVEPRRRIVTPWFELDCDGVDAPHDICRGESAPVLVTDTSHPPRGQPRHGRVTVWAARASRSAALVDLDGDGDLDVITNDYGDHPRLLLSDLAQRRKVNYLSVRLRGHRSNRDGLGAKVTVRAGGRAQVQQHDGKSGYLAQSVLPLYFGLGEAAVVDAIEISWPGGRTQMERGPIQAGQSIVLEER